MHSIQSPRSGKVYSYRVETYEGVFYAEMGNPESKYLKTQAKVIVYRDGKMFSFADITDTSEEFVASKVQSIINWYEYPVQKDFVSSRYD